MKKQNRKKRIQNLHFNLPSTHKVWAMKGNNVVSYFNVRREIIDHFLNTCIDTHLLNTRH